MRLFALLVFGLATIALCDGMRHVRNQSSTSSDPQLRLPNVNTDVHPDDRSSDEDADLHGENANDTSSGDSNENVDAVSKIYVAKTANAPSSDDDNDDNQRMNYSNTIYARLLHGVDPTQEDILPADRSMPINSVQEELFPGDDPTQRDDASGAESALTLLPSRREKRSAEIDEEEELDEDGDRMPTESMADWPDYKKEMRE